jgi:hypothetical protein
MKMKEDEADCPPPPDFPRDKQISIWCHAHGVVHAGWLLKSRHRNWNLAAASWRDNGRRDQRISGPI